MSWPFDIVQFSWRDAVDIVLVAVIIYNILKLIRGTRAMQMSVGLTLLGGAYLLARSLELLALERLAREIFFYLPFAIVVLFQHEIRAALANFGRNPLVAIFTPKGNGPEIDAIVAAAGQLAHHRTGALIVLERTQSLRMYIEAGREIDARVSVELLLNLFAPNTPLHDGAVVIRNGRIAAAGVFLPLSDSSDVPGEYGTRHRAALGLSEETDAIIVIISEENGSISVAKEGRLSFGLSQERLSAFFHEARLPRRSAA